MSLKVNKLDHSFPCLQTQPSQALAKPASLPQTKQLALTHSPQSAIQLREKTLVHHNVDQVVADIHQSEGQSQNRKLALLKACCIWIAFAVAVAAAVVCLPLAFPILTHVALACALGMGVMVPATFLSAYYYKQKCDAYLKDKLHIEAPKQQSVNKQPVKVSEKPQVALVPDDEPEEESDEATSPICPDTLQLTEDKPQPSFHSKMPPSPRAINKPFYEEIELTTLPSKRTFHPEIELQPLPGKVVEVVKPSNNDAVKKSQEDFLQQVEKYLDAIIAADSSPQKSEQLSADGQPIDPLLAFAEKSDKVQQRIAKVDHFLAKAQGFDETAQKFQKELDKINKNRLDIERRKKLLEEADNKPQLQSMLQPIGLVASLAKRPTINCDKVKQIATYEQHAQILKAKQDMIAAAFNQYLQGKFPKFFTAKQKLEQQWNVLQQQLNDLTMQLANAPIPADETIT